ncbi:hypothetical protein ACFVYT_05955 [Streptomyces sp. NPDC058290]|uniref:hypothetical protein n=1 Tax=Streptomyces sp. NPDC058290 TaxID=3346426 RepID=UPI0036E0E648
MSKLQWNRRVVLAAASVTLAGGGVALPATAMAAPAAPQHGVTLAPQNENGHTPGGIEGAYRGGVDVNLGSESQQVANPPDEGDDEGIDEGTDGSQQEAKPPPHEGTGGNARSDGEESGSIGGSATPHEPGDFDPGDDSTDPA